MIQDPNFVSDARKKLFNIFWKWLGLSFLLGPSKNPKVVGRKNLSFVSELA